LALSLFLAMQTCEASRQRVEQDAKAYFPHSTAVQDGNTMLVYTCTDLGLAAVNELAPIISERLQKYKGADFASHGGWRTLSLGFENQIVLIDMTSRTDHHEVIPAVSYPGYSRNYTEKCNSAVKADAAQPAKSAAGNVPPTTTGDVARMGPGFTPPSVIS